MSSTPNAQAAKFAESQAHLALAWKDYQASNVWWAIKVHLLYGRPEVRCALAALSVDGLCRLATAQHWAGSDPAAAWWAIKHYTMQQKEQVYAPKERAISFRDRRAVGARAVV